MAGESSSKTLLVAGIGATTVLVLGLMTVAMIVIKRIKFQRGLKRSLEGFQIIQSKPSTWYDPSLLKNVPEQWGHGDVHVEEGLLAVTMPVKRAKSAECLNEICKDVNPSNLMKTRELCISSQSLASLDVRDSFDLSPRRHSYTLRSDPYVEFNLLWATSTLTLSVYVIRITGLPPSLTNATCSYKVTLHKPDKTAISRSSNKVRKITLNPDCFQVFSFKIPFEDVRKSKLVLEVYARKSKHLTSKSIGQLNYAMPFNLTADKPITTSKPLNLHKKICSSISPRASLSSVSGSSWGELQLLAQYQITGGWQGRIKIMVIKAQNFVIGKGNGYYRVELIIKKGEETQEVFQTKQARGPNPVWKVPFIFDVTQSKINDYRVELSLIRTSRLKKSTTVGQALLGLDTTPSGTKHWEELIISPNKEITLWHPMELPEE